MKPIISFRDVTKRFGALTVLDHFNFDVSPGEKVTLIGPSGSGKSTVLRILMTLEPFTTSLTGMAPSGPANSTCTRSAAMSAWCFRASTCFRT
jgi:ABC-type polar amino acid transport system ATPase subunit